MLLKLHGSKLKKDAPKQPLNKRIRVVVSSARIENLEITDATTQLMRRFAAGEITSREAVASIVTAYAPRGS